MSRKVFAWALVSLVAAPALPQPEFEDGRLSFAAQLPSEPGVYDAPASTSSPCAATVSPMEIAWAEPSTGVNPSTGLLLVCFGIGPGNDCTRGFGLPDPAWPDSRDVVVANVFYRNLAYLHPYDFGKLQMVDMLRGMGVLLDHYPQIDRRRLYLWGGSGGGHLALQLLHATPELWSEVVVNSAISRITVRDDVLALYEEDPFSGWNTNLNFPTAQGSLPSDLWDRYRSERDLRSPQFLALSAPLAGGDPLLPAVAMLHGTADTVVDFQHLLDMRNVVSAASGIPAQPNAGGGESVANWRFISIVGGGHGFEGAAADEASRVAATNKYIPAAFTRVRPAMPPVAVDAFLESDSGWAWRLQGASLSSVSLFVENAPASASGWHRYE